MPGPDGVCYPSLGPHTVSGGLLHSSCLMPGNCGCIRHKLPVVLRRGHAPGVSLHIPVWICTASQTCLAEAALLSGQSPKIAGQHILPSNLQAP